VKISIVITTYNRPDALTLVLRGLAAQTAGDFEVLVADDGSTAETAAALAALKPSLPYPLRHVWQPDGGFRAPMANRFTPLLRLVDWSQARRDWVGAKTCNLAVWRNDLLAVNGFDEDFVGWGYEDSDLVQRLLNAGRRRRATRWAVPVLHLWHAAQDRSRERANLARLEQTVASGTERAARGIDQYLTPEPAGIA